MIDLFQQEETERTELSGEELQKLKEAISTHWVSVVCECGKKIGARLSHWDIMVCPCGRKYWALRPKRFSPLVLFPWPGCWQEGVRLA